MQYPPISPFPFWRDLTKYQLNFFWRDLLAAISVALLALPQAVAYAFLAGLPPSVGIYLRHDLYGGVWGLSLSGLRPNNCDGNLAPIRGFVDPFCLLSRCFRSCSRCISNQHYDSNCIFSRPVSNHCILSAFGSPDSVCQSLSHYWIYAWNRCHDFCGAAISPLWPYYAKRIYTDLHEGMDFYK